MRLGRLRNFRPLRRQVRFALMVVLLGAPPAAAQSVAFSFDPPAPLSWTESVRTTRTDEGPHGAGREFVLLARNDVDLVRDGDGYRMTVRPRPLRQIRNNREVRLPANPLEDLIQQAVFTYTLDAGGALVSVTGHEDVMRRFQAMVVALMEQIPAESRPQFAATAHRFAQMLEPEAILARMRAEWAGRVSDFDGAQLEVGRPVTSESDFTLPDGSQVRYFNVLRLEEIANTPEGRRARLAYRYDTDPGALKDFAGEALRDLGAPAPTSAEVRGDGERVVDPATLLIHSETQRRTVVMEAPGPDGAPVRATRTEVREYSYNYAAPGGGG